MSQKTQETLFERIRTMVRRIPAGKVAYYSQIGRYCGGCDGRIVGFAMASLDPSRDADVPWQRVINISGRISPHGFGGLLQRELLEQEGVVFRPDGSIDFDQYLWSGPN